MQTWLHHSSSGMDDLENEAQQPFTRLIKSSRLSLTFATNGAQGSWWWRGTVSPLQKQRANPQKTESADIVCKQHTSVQWMVSRIQHFARAYFDAIFWHCLQSMSSQSADSVFCGLASLRSSFLLEKGQHPHWSAGQVTSKGGVGVTHWQHLKMASSIHL